MTFSVAILALVTLQRLSELMIARRNTAALLAAGGTEHGASHYPVMVILHAGWLLGLWWLARHAPLCMMFLAIYFILQVLRAWVLITLGPRWTTRIITMPGERLVTGGPYRYLDHPNYAVVTAEIAVLPLMFGLVDYAIIFSVLNAAMLAWRISVENHALHGTG